MPSIESHRYKDKKLHDLHKAAGFEDINISDDDLLNEMHEELKEDNDHLIEKPTDDPEQQRKELIKRGMATLNI